MTEKQVFNKDNLSSLLRLQADALDKGEVLEFEEGTLVTIHVSGVLDDLFTIKKMGGYKSITLNPKPKMRKATAMEWLEWSCDYEECKGCVVINIYQVDVPHHSSFFDYASFTGKEIESLKRAKFENGKLGEFDYFWKEVEG